MNGVCHEVYWYVDMWITCPSLHETVKFDQIQSKMNTKQSQMIKIDHYCIKQTKK